tara:strand:+ start:205 stop:1701 length:1497 start_codon:yes stop_codon:yes gene_type:complete
MTIINPKSITGVTSITTPSGSDNLFTVHTNNTTERIRINNDGDVIVGSGITVSSDGDIFATGVCTATSFVGSGANLTGVASTENIRTNTNATFLQNINVSGTSTVGGDLNIADKIVHIGDTNTAIRFPAADEISLEGGGSTRVKVDSSGRLLVGGLTSDSRTTSMIINGNSSTGATGQAILNMDIGTTSISDGTSIGVFRFGATGDRRGADIKAEGAGTWSAGSSHPTNLIFSTNAASSASTPTERLRITSGGIVQIGGATENSADIDTSNTKLTIKQSGGGAEDGIYLERTGERRGHYIYVGGGLSQSDALCVTTNQLGTDTDLLAIDRGGDIAVGAGDIFFSTSGKGIVLGATSNTDSNTLDDYEEGVHTMTQLGSGGGVPLSNAVIRYTKIGNICQVSGMLDVGNASGSSSVEISLPFTSKADSGTTKSRTTSALMHKYCDVNNSYINIVGYIGQNENYFRIYNVADNNDWHQFLSGDFNANNAELFFTFVYQTA